MGMDNRTRRLVEELTEALSAASGAYHSMFNGDPHAMKAYRHPEWSRLVKRARRTIAKKENAP